jgi:hypothetical protein
MRLGSTHPSTEVEPVGESHLLLRSHRHPSGAGPHGSAHGPRPVSAVAEAAATTAVLLGASPPRGSFIVGSPILVSSMGRGSSASQGSKKGILGASPPRGSFLVGSPILRSSDGTGPSGSTGSGGARSSPLPVSSSSGGGTGINSSASSAQTPKQGQGSKGRPPAGPPAAQSSSSPAVPVSPQLANQPPQAPVQLSNAAGGQASHILESVVVGFSPAVVLDKAGGSSGCQPAVAAAVTPPPKPGKGSRGRTPAKPTSGTTCTPHGYVGGTSSPAVLHASTTPCTPPTPPQLTIQAPKSTPVALPTAANFAAELSRFMAGQVAGPRGAARRNARRQAQAALQEQSHHHLHEQLPDQQPQEQQGVGVQGQVQGSGLGLIGPSTSSASAQSYGAWLQGQQVHVTGQLQGIPVIPVVPITITGAAAAGLGLPTIASAVNGGLSYNSTSSSNSASTISHSVPSNTSSSTQVQQSQVHQQAGPQQGRGTSPCLPPARGASPPSIPRELHLVRLNVPVPSRQRPLAGLWKGMRCILHSVGILLQHSSQPQHGIPWLWSLLLCFPINVHCAGVYA